MNAHELLARSHALLLDFDGPVCSVFAGISAAVVAGQLRAVLADDGHVALPDDVAAAEDPFVVLRHAATLGANEARYVDAAFAVYEVEAIATAVATPGSSQLICEWHASGRPLAIVSNNSLTAIAAYLDLYDLRSCVDYIAARTEMTINLLKPNPYLLGRAISAIGALSKEAVLIGDSVSDIEAAHAAGVRVLAYANKPGKRTALGNLSPDLVFDRLTDLVSSPI